MIAWYWVVIALVVGASLGVFCLALFCITRSDDRADAEEKENS